MSIFALSRVFGVATAPALGVPRPECKNHFLCEPAAFLRFAENSKLFYVIPNLFWTIAFVRYVDTVQGLLPFRIFVAAVSSTISCPVACKSE